MEPNNPDDTTRTEQERTIIMRCIITTLLTAILSITAAVCFLLVGIEDTGLTPSQTLLVGAAALAFGALAVLVHDDAHDADRAGRGEPMA
ncbi:MAG: hypothetical protein KH404_04690 [Bifidobacterium pseudolongum]|nr:hypothetical protein [Bifidobacterium pseudolongum]